MSVTESVCGDESPSRSVSFIQHFDKSFTKSGYLPTLRPKSSYICAQTELMMSLRDEFSTKTGARAAMATNSMPRSIKMLQRMVYIVDKMLNTKAGLLEKKYHKSSLVPWVSHFDRFLTHLVSILNDRISLIWRMIGAAGSASPALLCGLFQDICDISQTLNKLLVVFMPRVTRSGTDTGSSSTPRSFRTSGFGGSCMIPILKLLSSKVKAVLFRVFVPLQNRIESLIAFTTAAAMNKIETNCIVSHTFNRVRGRCVLRSSSSSHHLAESVISSVLDPYLIAIKCLSRSPGAERILTAVINTTVEHLFLYLRTHRCRFNETGVALLHSQLQAIVLWVSRAKSEVGIPSSVSLILDKSPWHRANAILQVLQAATNDSSAISTSANTSEEEQENRTSRLGPLHKYLSASDREKWVDLAGGGVGIDACLPRAIVIALKRRQRHVSMLTVLDTRNL